MLQVSRSDRELTVRFEGCIDTARCAEVEPELRAALDNSGLPLVFDLAEATFVSSSFLRLCVFAMKQAGEGRFQIVHAIPPIKKVFKIAGLDSMLKGG